MSSNGGGGSNLLDMGLMIAAGVAAPEVAGALAPEIMAAGGVGGAAVGAATGAGLSALTAAATGQNALKAAEMGGLGGALTGYMPDTVGTGTQGAGATPPPVEQAPVNTPMEGVPPPVKPPVTPPTDNLFGSANAFSPSGSLPTNTQMYLSGGINALGAMNTKPAGAYTPPGAVYSGGSLQKFKYDPNNYTPDVVNPPRPVYQANYSGYAGSPYAEGGITSLKKNVKHYDIGGSATASATNNGPLTGSGGNAMADMVQQALGSQGMQNEEVSQMKLVYDPKTGQYVLPQKMASGGISNLGSYSDGGRLLKGGGDGMSDSIPATIAGKQEARLADGEFVVPADVVSHLGNGSTDAGAKQLYSMMNKVRKARTGNPKQGKQIKAEKYLPA